MEMHRISGSLENHYNSIRSETPSNTSTYCSINGPNLLNTGSVSSRDVQQSNEHHIYDFINDSSRQKNKVRSSRAVIVCLVVVLSFLLAALIAPTLYVTVFKGKADEQGGKLPENGTWDDWQTWSDCSVSSSNCVMIRNRSCDNPPPSFGGYYCEGPASENRSCNLTDCYVNGKWSVWLAWSHCSASCDNGSRTRNRTCDNPVPAFGGKECDGVDTDSEVCMIKNCSINGNWSSWQNWGDCSITCNKGSRTRQRTCDNPNPAFGGDECDGDDTESDVCMIKPCPINGNWGVWLAWSHCSASCDNGTRTRNRTCDSPAPAFGGDACDGVDTDSDVCMIKPCPINGTWSSWQPWSDCSTTCGGGIKNRTRVCDNPACGEGVLNRARICNNFAGFECIGNNSETKDCQKWKCYDSWGEWSACSFACGSGIRTRNRTCDGKFTGEECGLNTTTFKDKEKCVSSESCKESFCASRNGTCSYKHPHRSDLYITCDGNRFMYERMCNVLMRYKVCDDDECVGYCDREDNVPK